MGIKYYSIKFIAIVTAILAIVFSLTDWVVLGLSEDTTKSERFSFMNLSEMITEKEEHTGDSLIDTMAKLVYGPKLEAATTEEETRQVVDDLNDTITFYALIILIPCALVKFLMLLSVVFTVYGLFKCHVLEEHTKMITVSQVICLVIQILLYLVLGVYNLFDITIASLRINDIVVLRPTSYMLLSTAMSLVAIILSKVYQKSYLSQITDSSEEYDDYEEYDDSEEYKNEEYYDEENNMTEEVYESEESIQDNNE